MQLVRWLSERGGIEHRQTAMRAGISAAAIRMATREGSVRGIRRFWLALPAADPALVAAAQGGGRLSCVSLARRRGWWIESEDPRVHLQRVPGSGTVPDLDPPAVLHWTKPLVPSGPSLVAPVEDALQHVAFCLPFDHAIAVWESAVRIERLAPEYLRSLPWSSVAARNLAEAVRGLSDSGLETLVVTPLLGWGVRVRQQVVLAGRPVDVLVGERLVIQIDGWQFHSSPAQRAKDIAHDAELRLRGYTVIRFSYAQVIHDRVAVLRTIQRSVAAGLHQVGARSIAT